ncbi:MAG: thiamine phosphate synthase [Chloroflexi bacterium]|nr:thiamine phosphate synthase [Chloroflexota bacterium]
MPYTKKPFSSRLHLVSDRSLCKKMTLEEAVAQAMEGGVDAVHLRERDMPSRELWQLACRLRDITRGQALLIINDRVDVALASNADGVQLGAMGLPVSAARKIIGKRLFIGASVHSVEEAVQAEREGADYILLGTIYASRSHPDIKPAGPELVKKASEVVRIPIIAIGGIDAGNAPEVIKAGADGIAVISAILGSEDVRGAARSLLASIAG